jgi:predicted aspartyl protease
VQNAFETYRVGEVTASVQLARNIGGTVGTAILGGVMNAQLTKNLSSLSTDPFVRAMREVAPQSPIATIDSNSVQSVLNPDVQATIRASLEHAPGAQALMPMFNTFVETIKVAFTNSVVHVFVVASVLMAIGWIVVLFLREIPLRSHAKESPLEKAGRELEEEFGSDAPSSFAH